MYWKEELNQNTFRTMRSRKMINKLVDFILINDIISKIVLSNKIRNFKRLIVTYFGLKRFDL